MDVALQHFANEGYHNTTITQIAKLAGISKGLMYNYFESKEVLLLEIINRSINEISRYFDPDHDGYLSEDEFELFVRKLFLMIREKISFWRLFYQLLMQKEVRGQFLKSNAGPVDTVQQIYSGSGNDFLSILSKMISEYFMRKKDKKSAGYDPVLDLNMFIYTMEGFAMVTVYMDDVDDNYYEKTINRIIELYK